MKKALSMFLGIALTAILAVSCNDISGTGSIIKGSDTNLDGTVLFTVNVDSITPSRNIMPDDWTAATANTLYYVLTGDTTDGEQSNEVPTASDANKFTYNDIADGKAKIALKPTTWYLVLTAYQDAECTKVALKSEIVAIDLSAGNKNHEFVMKAPAANETTATGSANVTVQFPKSTNFASVTYGIYNGNLPTSETASFATENDVTKTSSDADSGLVKVNEAGTYSFNYTNSSIKAGKYYFNATFYDDNSNIIGFYSDTIVIDGANTSSKTITLGDIFNKPATNPTALSVGYAYNDTNADNTIKISDGMKAISLAEGAATPNKYYATFTWDDKSDNETGYELILTNANDSADEITYNASSVPVAGSFGASSTTATVELDTGKEYTAKIRAVNTFTNTAVYKDMEDSVNLFTVTYTLVNGIVKISTTSDTSATVVKYVVPYNKASAAQAILSASSANYPYVYRTGYNFVKWYESSDTTDMAPVEEVAADNYENIELTAYWESSLGVTVKLPSYQSTEDLALVSNQSEGSTITVAGAPVSPATSTAITLKPNSGLAIDDTFEWTIYDTDFTTPITANIVISADKELTWTITAPAVEDDPATDEDEAKAEVSVPAGTYRVAVKGTQVSTNTEVTGNIYIKITR